MTLVHFGVGGSENLPGLAMELPGSGAVSHSVHSVAKGTAVANKVQ